MEGTNNNIINQNHISSSRYLNLESLEDTIPVILNGKFFKIISIEICKNGFKKVKAKCCNCVLNDPLSGFMSATTNFLRHLRVSSNYILSYYLMCYTFSSHT